MENFHLIKGKTLKMCKYPVEHEFKNIQCYIPYAFLKTEMLKFSRCDICHCISELNKISGVTWNMSEIYILMYMFSVLSVSLSVCSQGYLFRVWLAHRVQPSLRSGPHPSGNVQNLFNLSPHCTWTHRPGSNLFSGEMQTVGK